MPQYNQDASNIASGVVHAVTCSSNDIQGPTMTMKTTNKMHYTD